MLNLEANPYQKQHKAAIKSMGRRKFESGRTCFFSRVRHCSHVHQLSSRNNREAMIRKRMRWSKKTTKTDKNYKNKKSREREREKRLVRRLSIQFLFRFFCDRLRITVIRRDLCSFFLCHSSAVRSVTERVHRKHGERLREEDEGHGCGSSHSCSQDTAPQALAVSEAGEE